jgi:hypothetical protein
MSTERFAPIRCSTCSHARETASVMGDFNIREWVPAIAILGPILAAIIAAFVTRHFRERKRLQFIIGRTEDLTSPLRRSSRAFSLKINDTEVQNLNRGVVVVSCKGNTTIKDLEFDVLIPGQHLVRTSEAIGATPKLAEAVKAEFVSDGRPSDSDLFHVTVPFLNPGEWFNLRLFFDGEPHDCDVALRMEGVKHSVKRSDRITAFGPEGLEFLLLLYFFPRPLRRWLRAYAARIASVDSRVD